jgi:hypothetical protein
VSAREAQAAATLARLGLDPEAIRAGRVPATELAAHLAGPEGLALAGALGEFATPEVAALLVELEPGIGARPVRKEVRRALYRLRQRGVPVPQPTAPSLAATAAAPPAAEGLLSAFDARGDRVIWIVRPLPAGASLLVLAQLNEPGGLRDLHVSEGTKKQLRTVRQRMEAESGFRLVPADWRTLDALLVEAHERAAASERERDYLRVRPRLTSEPPRPPAEPVSRRAPPPGADEVPALAAGSATLLDEVELRGWYPPAEAAAPFVEEIRTVRASPLVLSRPAEAERVREVLRRAAAILFPPVVLARRLEGTAYVLAETGRISAARQALAVARVLGERPADALEVPLVAALVERGVGSLLAETTAREEEERQSALVVTPGQFLRDRASSRPGRTRA